MQEVQLHIYDVSQGMAKQFSGMILGKTIDGVWHTGIVVYGKEYYFGGGISYDPPSRTPFGISILKILLLAIGPPLKT
jgi:hypothetical protein